MYRMAYTVCRREDERGTEKTMPSYAEAKKIKSLTLVFMPMVASGLLMAKKLQFHASSSVCSRNKDFLLKRARTQSIN